MTGRKKVKVEVEIDVVGKIIRDDARKPVLGSMGARERAKKGFDAIIGAGGVGVGTGNAKRGQWGRCDLCPLKKGKKG